MFWGLNPRTLKPFNEAFRMRMERESEAKSSEIDITAWSVGLYVQRAIVAALDKNVEYPGEPLSIQKKKTESMTAKDHANEFRNFLAHYKRPPVAKQGGETHGD